jgi:hypothetical protein
MCYPPKGKDKFLFAYIHCLLIQFTNKKFHDFPSMFSQYFESINVHLPTNLKRSRNQQKRHVRKLQFMDILCITIPITSFDKLYKSNNLPTKVYMSRACVSCAVKYGKELLIRNDILFLHSYLSFYFINGLKAQMCLPVLVMSLNGNYSHLCVR